MNRVRHKEANRFKFISFSERIANVNIDVFHRIPHRYEEESAETTTYFYLAVQKWAVLNLTEKWVSFKKQIGNEIETLPQLLNNKEKIIDVFLKNIRLQNELSLQPVLELMVALVKDLRHEFYPFYPQVLKELIYLLKFKDPDVLEATFTCLAYIFKYLFREMVKDLDKVMLDLATLFKGKNPDYVIDFAAQSFSFVARKVKDKNKLLSLVLYAIQSSPEVSVGCGQLLFEMMKGIKGHTHSCAEEMLLVLFNSLGKSEVPQKSLFSLTDQVVESYGNYIYPQYSILFRILNDVIKSKLESEDRKGLKKMLRITRTGLNCKGGAHLNESCLPQFVPLMVKILALDLDTQKLAVDICSDMLNLKNFKLPQEYGSRLINTVMQSQYASVVLQFTEATSTCPVFEPSILPRALLVFSTSNFSDFVKLFAKISVNKTITTTKTFDGLDVYPLQLTSSTTKIFDFVDETIRKFEDFEQTLHCLVLLRHLNPIDQKEVILLLNNFVKRLLNILKKEEEKEKHLFVLCVTLETLLYFKKEFSESGKINEKMFCEVILKILQNDKSIMALRIINLFLTLNENYSCDDEYFNELYNTLQEWLVSPQSNSRKLALHSLKKLQEKIVESTSGEMVAALQNALDAEFIPLTVTDYREKLKLLEKLNFNFLSNLPEENHKVLLKYLLGVLYCNFKLLWEPVSQMISDYSVGMNINKFWEVFYSQLRRATISCKDTSSFEDYSLPQFDEFLLISVKFIKAEDKPVHYNYKYLLWNAMNLFSDVCETKNRDVVSDYLSFIEEKLLKTSAEHNLTINLKRFDSNVLNETENEEVKKEEVKEDTEDVKSKDNEKEKSKESKKGKSKGSNGDILKCVVAQLTLLSKFKNPKQTYREPDVRNSYLDLLIYKDQEIQKMALECLLSYKFTYMTPYKQNLRNLVDNKKFKDELIHFQIDTTTGVVKEEHRQELMPIVMRILYSKMIYGPLTPRGSKTIGSLFKKSIVTRFLAGSSHSEMEVFLKLAFKKLNVLNEGDSLKFEKFMSTFDLEKVPSPKKLQNIVYLTEVIIKNFGGLMSVHLQRFIYKILLSVGFFVAAIFSKRDEIFSGHINSLKNLRKSCVDSVMKFFERFQNFPWTEEEINPLFETFVWPNVTKLPVESIGTPTILLRLFLTWSKNPRCFKLLARYHPQNEDITPIPFIMKLLLNEKTQPAVTGTIENILENLLTLQEEQPMEVDGEEEIPPININYVLPIDEAPIKALNLKEELNYGSKILFPHVGSLLLYLLRKMEKSYLYGLRKSHSTILSRITEMATSAEHGDGLMKLLIKLLTSGKRTDDETLVNMISTVANLTNVVKDPASYLRSLSVLFGTVESIQGRKILVSLVTGMENRCPELKGVVGLVEELNAWNWRWIEQPNFEARLEAFKKIRSLVEEKKLNIDLAFIILHNCFFFVRCESDLSLRDNASYCLKVMCPKITKTLKNKPSDRRQWVESILSLTKKGITSSNENYQTLSVILLGVMARECGSYHEVLKDLSVLTDKDDPEVDFFENAQHLQVYRREKALHKFCAVAKTLKKTPKIRTLVQFILPLASRYLCNEKYSGRNSLIDAAIDAVGTVCKFLQWQQYQTVLKFYLMKLRTEIDFQKQIIRTVIAILDSFHFDISKSSNIPKKNQTQNEKESQGSEKAKIVEKKEKLNGEIEKGEQEENKIVDEDMKENVEVEKKEKEDVDLEKGEKEEMEVEKEEKEDEEEEKEETVEEKEDDEEDKDETGEEKKEKDDAEGEKEDKEKIETLEELAEVLNVEEDEEEENEKKEPEKEEIPAIDRITVLKPSSAIKVEKIISENLLQRLYKVIGQKTQLEETHKLNYKHLGPDKDKEDVLKIPIAVTLVKLLQKLPERMLEAQLPGIFMRLCTYLKSRMEAVRRVTRVSLQQIMFSVGPKYLPLLLSEITAALTKGFHLHVSVYTMNAVVQRIESLLKPGDIDPNIPVLLEACKLELFGSVSEEKEVTQIQTKHHEARTIKSYHLVHLISKYMSEKNLTDLIIPVKDILQRSYSHKNIIKCREYLRQVTLGLTSNQYITLENLFIYIYGTISESIPQLLPNPPEPPKKKNPKEKQDCFILPPQPKSRTGVSSNPVKKGSRSNAHIIIEFGLHLLHTILKKDEIKKIPKEIKRYLDPIVPELVKALESQHVKVSTYSLQCLTKAFKYSLPNVIAEVSKIRECIFIILHKYAVAGLWKGDNFDLVREAFKAISTLIREADYHGITEEQLKILLLYTEQDIYDTSRQATAFNLLRVILKKKLNCPELHELMQKVAALSVTSEHPQIRLQARQNLYRYIMNYPLKKKLEEFIGFFVSQLNFEVESGRQSSLEMIQSFINSFPEKVLEDESGVFMLTLGARLVNDDSANCKKTISGIIKAMLSRLNVSNRDNLFGILLLWFQQKKITHRMLAAQVAGIFVTVEKENFENRLPNLLPLIPKQFVGNSGPGQFVRLQENTADEDRLKDHHFFHVLQLLLKICTNCPVFLTSEKYQENIYLFTEISQSLLCHPHEWVRLAAAQFLGHVFNSCEANDVAAIMNGEKVDKMMPFFEPATIHKRIKSLILDHCAQFIPGIEIAPEFLEQLTKNLVYFARVLKVLKPQEEQTNGENGKKVRVEVKEENGDVEEEEEDEDEDDDEDVKEENEKTEVDDKENGEAENGEEVDVKEENEEKSIQNTLTFHWLTKRMRRIVNMELGRGPFNNPLRTAVLKWIGAVVMCSTKSELKPVLYHLMAPVVREIEVGETEENPLKNLVTEICGLIKKKIGVDEYSKEVMKIRRTLMEKRMKRRTLRAQEFVTDPERALKRKMERQVKKKEAKRRKIEKLKGKSMNKFKRRKKTENDIF